MKVGADPNTYKVPCEKVFEIWETEVGKADIWSPDDSKALKALLKKLGDTVDSPDIKKVMKIIP